jgi:DNA polymerase III epsilon subunit-like protein
MIAILDVETTGLDPAKHEIVEIGAILVNEEFDIIMQFERQVKPERIDDADPIALAINGYDPEKWHEAVSIKRALIDLLPFVEGDTTIAGWGVSFDVSFLRQAYAAACIEWPNTRRRTLDICSVAQFCYPRLPSFSLTAVAEALRIHPGNHRAMADALCALEVARKLKGLIHAK